MLFWTIIFIASMALLVKSADWFVESAEKIGLALKVSPFIIGVTIVAIGTSFPELASSFASVFKSATETVDPTEIVVANALGSNIANIFLIVGISAVIARSLIVKRSLIDLDSPLLATTSAVFLFVAWDKKIDFWEGLILIAAFIIYLLYTVFQKREGEDTPELVEILPSRMERRGQEKLNRAKKEDTYKKLNFKTFFFLIIGGIGLAVGANYTIESVINLSGILKIGASLIAITAIAIGTSLPELIVSIRAALKKKYELALGNVFGSNIFNILLVVGAPALVKQLNIDAITFSIGLPFFIAATLLFIISGISRRIYAWEGAMFLLIYFLFIAKLIGIF